MRTREKALKAAAGIIPLGANNRDLIISWFVKGYMTGHAAHTRWANKKVFELRSAQGKTVKP